MTREVETAMEKEPEQKSTVLCSIRLDTAVVDLKTARPADIRTRPIGDFTDWKDRSASSATQAIRMPPFVLKVPRP